MHQPFDSTLQMFIDTPAPVSLEHLRFLRWLGEHGRLEHAIAGPPSGSLAFPPAEIVETPAPTSSGRAS